MTASAAGGYRHPEPAPRIVDARGGARSLAESYELCRRISAAHGRTYHLAARILPGEARRHVHALYAFARYADDLVDHAGLGWTPAQRRSAFEAWSAGVVADVARGSSEDPVLAALVRTVDELGIAVDDLVAFLRSMAMDLEVTRYPTYDDLAVYMHGSAAVVGAMMLPVLGAEDPRARGPALRLGVAFQLTNFLRDVDEDLDRGRVYLPLEDLARFGVDVAELERRRVGPGLRRALAFEAARARELYARAEAGWALLPPRSAAAIRVAHRLYARILDRIEAEDWQVFERRASLSTARRGAEAAAEVLLPSRPRATMGA